MSETVENTESKDGKAEKSVDPDAWLLDHTIDQLKGVGRQIGVSGVAFLVAAIVSVLLNLGASDDFTFKLLFVEVVVQNATPVRVLMFLAALGMFIAMMYCFAIFATLLNSVEFLAERREKRALVLLDLRKHNETKHRSLNVYTQWLRNLIVGLSILVLLLAFGTFLQALKG